MHGKLDKQIGLIMCGGIEKYYITDVQQIEEGNDCR